MAQTWNELRREGPPNEFYSHSMTRGAACEMANASLNGLRQGGVRGGVESITSYQLRTGKGDVHRGALGNPRLYARCQWPLQPCTGCGARHIDLSGVVEQVAA